MRRGTQGMIRVELKKIPCTLRTARKQQGVTVDLSHLQLEVDSNRGEVDAAELVLRISKQ